MNMMLQLHNDELGKTISNQLKFVENRATKALELE
jgi:hypothetical protein